MKQVTITELRRRAAEVIGELREGPVLMIQHGQPAAVLITTEDYERMERALAEVDARQVCEIVEAGLNIAWPKTSS
jgi:prevent-host-death family protein